MGRERATGMPRPTSVAETPHAARDGVVRLWLLLIAGLIVLTALVGAATRLTGSGLSITEWNVLFGILPPLGEAQWLEAFEKYKAIPQYQQLNKGMSLAAFKGIFWWEWVHRILGRLIGLAFAVPFLVFLWRGWLRPGLARRLTALLALGCLQGVVGWYMVQSGLAERTDVSQYRLALHLGLAATIFVLVLWTALDLGQGRERQSFDLATMTRRQRAMAHGVAALIYLQILLGALVAGLKAGRTHNTWPLMDGALVPGGLGQLTPWWHNLFENATLVQFNHRLLAFIIVVLAIVHAWQLVRSSDAARIRRSAAIVGGLALAQSALGVWTLLAWVPISLGIAHQAGALALLAAVVWHLHAIRGARSA